MSIALTERLLDEHTSSDDVTSHINQSVNQSINQSVKPLEDEIKHNSMYYDDDEKKSIDEPYSSFHQSVTQPINHSLSQARSAQSVNQPINQSIDSSNNSSFTGSIKLLLANKPLLYVVMFATLGGLVFGYEVGVMGGVIVLSDFRQTFDLPVLKSGETDDSETSSKLAWVVSLFPLFCAVTAFLTGLVASDMSRRWTIFAGAAVFTFGGFIQAIAEELDVLSVGRVCGGLGIGVMSTVIPVYVSELASADLRGTLNSLFQLAITIGIVLAFTINWLVGVIGGGSAWRFSLAGQSVLSAILVLGIKFLPESPRLLVQKGQQQQARQVLERLRVVRPMHESERHSLNTARQLVIEKRREIDQSAGHSIELTVNQPNDSANKESNVQPSPPSTELGQSSSITSQPLIQPSIQQSDTASQSINQPVDGSMSNIDAELLEIRFSLELEFLSGRIGWLDLFRWGLLARFLAGCGVQLCQQLTFINAIMYYAPLLFSAIGVDPLAATALIGIVNVFSTLIALRWIDSAGRVPLLMFSAVGMLLASLSIAIFTALDVQWLVAIMLCLHVAAFALGWGPIGWVYPSEIFPLAARGKAVSCSTTVNWLGAFTVGSIVPQMLTKMGIGITFLVISACLVFDIVFTLAMLPETKGRTLESMHLIFQAHSWQHFQHWIKQNFNNNMKFARSNK